MSQKATITVYRSREEVERLWHERRPAGDAPVTFRDAPGGRGTEIYVEVAGAGPNGRLGELAEKVEDTNARRGSCRSWLKARSHSGMYIGSPREWSASTRSPARPPTALAARGSSGARASAMSGPCTPSASERQPVHGARTSTLALRARTTHSRSLEKSRPGACVTCSLAIDLVRGRLEQQFAAAS